VIGVNNEKGYTLITTLLIATLIVTVSFVLIGMALSTNKQIQSSEHDVQATDLAEMGFVYFQEKVNEIAASYTETARIAQEVNSKLRNKTVTIQSNLSETRQFQITFDSGLSENHLKTQVVISGCVGDCGETTSKKETITATLELKPPGDTSSDTVIISKGSDNIEVENCNKVDRKGKIEERCYFKNQQDLDTYLSEKKKHELEVHGATVYILSDVTVSNLKFTSNNNRLCVYGKLTVQDSTGNGNAKIYAYDSVGDFSKHIDKEIGSEKVITNCGSVKENNENWIPIISNIRYQ